jgi:DNA-directed RNA polymerase specialized sigma24 family protein
LPLYPKFTLLSRSDATLLGPAPIAAVGWAGPPVPGSARDFLERICDGDPLGLGPAARALVGARAYLVEPAHIADKAAARAAFEMARERRWNDSPDGVRAWLDRALARELEDQREAQSDPVPPEPGEFLGAVAERLGIQPALMHSAAVVFNALPGPVRRAFFGAFVRGQSLAELSAAGLGDEPTVRRRLRCALLSLSRLTPTEVDPADVSASEPDATDEEADRG